MTDYEAIRKEIMEKHSESIKELYISELKDQIERLRAALRELLEYEGGAFCVCDDPYVMDRARAALEGK